MEEKEVMRTKEKKVKKINLVNFRAYIFNYFRSKLDFQSNVFK